MAEYDFDGWMTFDGRVAFVTGAARRHGRSLALPVAAEKTAI